MAKPWVAALALLAGCAAPPAGKPAKESASSKPPVAEVAPVAAAPSSSAQLEEPPAKIKGRVSETGVADIVLGEPFPKTRITPALPKQYTTGFYADAQPLEGFALGAPPLYAVVKGGPFHPFGMDQPGQPIPPTMPTEAVARAQAGKLTVSMIVITDARLTTAEGRGVGSRFAELKKTYPKLSAFTLPGLWEEPSCIAKPDEDSKIHFFFAQCDGKREDRMAPDAEVIRVVITDAGKN